MKKLLFLLVAILTLFSCQDEFVPDEQLTTDVVDKTELLQLVNQNRTVGYVLETDTNTFITSTLNPLAWDYGLYEAAQLQVAYMYRTDDFNHEWSDGTTINIRVIRVGSNCNPVGENIAWGKCFNEQSVIDKWMNSKGKPCYTFTIAE